jgi:hypothetical protein
MNPASVLYTIPLRDVYGFLHRNLNRYYTEPVVRYYGTGI